MSYQAKDTEEPLIIPIDTTPHQSIVLDMATESAEQIEQRSREAGPVTVDDRLDFAKSVARGLEDQPRWLDCRYLYDARGSHIFERISEQPEYYLTRTEGAILAAVGRDIAGKTGDVRIIELGSGSSIKTRLLLEAYCDLYGEAHYTPVDISRAVLEHAEEELVARYDKINVTPLHGSYDDAFLRFNELSPSMLLFLGSTLGNLNERESQAFWQQTAGSLAPGDYCLLGIDINDDVDAIDAAYNDAAGYSEAFTRNLFERMNRELGAAIDVNLIDHVAGFNPERSRVEIYARFNEAQSIELAPLNRGYTIGPGEKILTEISCKFRLEQMLPYLRNVGFVADRVYTDSHRRFAVLLLRLSRCD